ncbi:MAG TPA: hypothetical protein VIL86_18225 [Tepidisphaeraceae bacterium]|jgi:hypothetical protein
MKHRIYHAIINGNQITWPDEAPRQQGPVAAEVTLLEEERQTPADREAMVRALERVAANGNLSEIDAVAWQREIRKDRELPGRD